ncbi:MAG: hypothetical protein EWV90_03230 [Microcystis aeruginosa Ma_QC_Ch_20071001_M135]|jgi:hypothetical protein|nr:MAG: hypothetical protein EWV90_03230 [Microcystis aeruginosa Ma_QC_Ch_20071001_M135]
MNAKCASYPKVILVLGFKNHTQEDSYLKSAFSYWDLGVFGQQKRLKPLRDKGLTSIYDFP